MEFVQPAGQIVEVDGRDIDCHLRFFRLLWDRLHFLQNSRCTRQFSANQGELLLWCRLVTPLGLIGQTQLEDVQVVLDDAQRVVDLVNQFPQTFFLLRTEVRKALGM